MILDKTKSLILIGSSAVIGIITDYLLRREIFGLNFLLWTILWVTILLISHYKTSKINYRICIYAAFALLNAGMVYIRAEPAVQVWSVLSTLSFLSIMFSSVYLVNFRELPLVKRFLEYVAGALMSSVRVMVALVKSSIAGRAPKTKKVQFTLGMLIAVILSLIFIGLFSSSDAVFRQNFNWLGDALTSFADWFNNFNLNIGRIVTVVFWAVVAFSWLAMAISRSKVTSTYEIKLFKLLSAKDSQVIVGAVSVIFAFFVFVQLRFLFGSSTLPDGITYADYARSGYGQLLLATMLASGVVYFAKSTLKVEASIAKWLPTLLLGLNALVVMSAWKRLSLYEDAYGWTMTRFVARMGLVCIMSGIVILLVWVYGKLNSKQLFSYSWYTLALVLLASAAVNPIGLITKRNIIDLPSKEVALDVAHLIRQSPDSYASLCTYASVLTGPGYDQPEAYWDLAHGFTSRSDGEYLEVVDPINYPVQLNTGLSAHYTRSQSFADNYYNCLK